MLTRLELVGFKSFADKTRFEFAPGITAVVGPNGSGKSNVVDAVKWILGEQSAKSLRGGEMADVIFNGSATRKSFGLAEVTLSFDNAKRELRLDADEVQVTRRVYRDGQGEYLINGQLSRLKDIKDLFLGSGAGHGAYSIIEQGRVDALLTASATDRRQIFEEAAGISRFKAKKLEALRKLDHTETNLNRVRDVLGELEKSLRTLNAQAAKAEKYQEYHAKLKELRVAAAAGEFARLSAELTAHDAALADLRASLTADDAKAAESEARLRELEVERGRADDGLRHQERRRSDARQRIAEHEAAARNGREQADALDADVRRLARQRADLGRRIRALEAASAAAAVEEESAATDATTAEGHATSAAAAVAEATATIARLVKQTDADRHSQFEWVSRSAQHHAAADRERQAVERLTRDIDRKNAEAARHAADSDALTRALTDLSESDADLQQRLTAARQAAAELQARQADLRRRADDLQPTLAALRDRRGDLRGRVQVLDDLDRAHDGVGAGVRAVLERATDLRLVADVIAAPRDIAPLVDVALGDAAQRFVLPDAVRADDLVASLGPLPGRVGFVPLQSEASGLRERAGAVSPAGELVVVGVQHRPAYAGRSPSLADLVTCDLPGLADRLLGNVLLADDLASARGLAAVHPTARIVTRTGELLEPDGTLTVGPPRTDAGLLSRKSELRELREQAAAVDAELAAAEADLDALKRAADALTAPLADRAAEIDTLAGAAGDLRDRIAQQRQKRDRLHEQADLLRTEAAIADGERQQASDALHRAETDARDADEQAAAVAARLAAADAAMKAAEQARAARQEADTAARVALEAAKQRLAAAAGRRQQTDDDLKRRRFDAINLSADEASARGRHMLATLAALRGTQAAADAYREKEARERLAAEWAARRAAVAAAWEHVQADLASARGTGADRRQHVHARELAVRELAARRDAVVTRVRDEYGLEIEAVPPGPAGDTDLSQVEELKRAIAKLGSVNLEALEQLRAEQAREAQIRGEYDDLVSARDSLLDIITRINGDSRRLFAETLDAVRGHFQELFRKLFGGGAADIVLENPADVLESGIEITARPPGKELRSISLLSGGEKTMTAVALLLAIFRSKPSPFCILDEVDAALDEANTARLAGVLREFCDRSQFIVITHKKRTMAAADVLIGVTMQESGVSKPVAARLEDWPDEQDARQAA